MQQWILCDPRSTFRVPLVYVKYLIIQLFLHAISNTSFALTKVSEVR